MTFTGSWRFLFALCSACFSFVNAIHIIPFYLNLKVLSDAFGSLSLLLKPNWFQLKDYAGDSRLPRIFQCASTLTNNNNGGFGRRIAAFYSSQAVSGVGTFLSQYALALAAFQSTGSSITVGLFQSLPLLLALIGPLLGAYADRIPVFKNLVKLNFFMGFWTLLYLAAWQLPGNYRLWVILALVVISKIPQGVLNPLYGRGFNRLVEGRNTQRYGALQSSVLQITTALGKWFGPELWLAVGPLVFVVDSITYAGANIFVPAFRLPEERLERPESVPQRRALRLPRFSDVRLAVQASGNLLRDAWSNLQTTGDFLRQLFGECKEALSIGLEQRHFRVVLMLYLGGFFFWGVNDTLGPAVVQAAGLSDDLFGRYVFMYSAGELVSTLIWAVAPRTQPTIIAGASVFGLSVSTLALSTLPGLRWLFAIKFIQGLFGNSLGLSGYLALVLGQDQLLTGRLLASVSSMGFLVQAAASLGVGLLSDTFSPQVSLIATSVVLLGFLLSGVVLSRWRR